MENEKIKMVIVGGVILLIFIYSMFLYCLMRKTFIAPREPKPSALASLMAPAGKIGTIITTKSTKN